MILLAAMRISHKSQVRGTERAELSQRIRIVADRISWLIRGAYPYIFHRPEGNKIFFQGEGDRVGFVTTSVDEDSRGPEDLAGLKWVSLYVDRKGLRVREKVYFLESALENEGGVETLLDPYVKKIEFSYLDVTGDDLKGSWTQEWSPDSKNYIPAAVKVAITFEIEGKKIEMPEMIVTIQARRKGIVTGP